MLLDLILQIPERDWNQLSPEEITLVRDYIRYSAEFEKTITELERGLHSTDDPKRIAMQTLITACEFYDADWCGILLIDLDIGVWFPYWWYDTKYGEMADTVFQEFEFSEKFGRWVTALKAGDAIVIDDVETLRESSPEEYENYRRLEADAMIGIPFWKRPTGYLVVRNPKKNKRNSNMLRIMAYVAVSTVNENKLIEYYKRTEREPKIKNENDLYIKMLGNLEVHGSKFDLDERRVNASMGWHILVYLLLHRQRNASYGELASHLLEETPTPSAANKVRGAIYRFRRNYEGLADEYLTISEGTGYGLNPYYKITTDTDLFEMYWIQSKELHSRVSRISHLKKAFALYRGPLFERAAGATWMMQEHYRLANIYTHVVNSLLEDLFTIKDYSCVQDYATRSFLIDPHNRQAYYWLIRALIKCKSHKLARDALTKAENILSKEDYEDLLIHLEIQGSGFIRENYGQLTKTPPSKRITNF